MFIRKFGLAVALTCVSSLSAFAQKGETVKIAWIDPLSGLMAPVGSNQLKSLQYLAEEYNKNNAAGVKFEIIGLDNKLSPAESLNQLKSAMDQGVRYITQGNGSSVAGALVDAINKHNERNPGKELIFLNQVVKYAKETLARKRPDIQIVGEDLHPLAQVRDFAPYIAKIKAAGADSVITGNWGSDLALLVKAANEGGYTGKFFTYYTGVTGTPTALGQGAAGRVYQVSYAHYNMGGTMGKYMNGFKAKFNDDLYTGSMISIFDLLTGAMAQAKTTDPVKVAAAMHGFKFKGFNGDMEMRKYDHQLQQTLYITVWQKADKKYPYSAENTGMTLAPVKTFEPYVSSTPTSCQMKMPS